MKTPEELNALTDEDLTQVSGGSMADSLRKLQEGMKINSGSDDSGGYQIDKKTREMIRQGIDPYKKDGQR